MNKSAYDTICQSLSNVSSYLMSALDRGNIADDMFKKYTFSWLGRIEGDVLNVVFKTATPSRFSHTTSHPLDQESHDIIFFSLAMEVLEKKHYLIRNIEKRDSFPTRRTSDPIYSCVVAFALYSEDRPYGTFSIYADDLIEQSDIDRLKVLAKDVAIMVDADNRELLVESLEVY